MNHRNITAKDVFNRMVELAEQDPDFRYLGQNVVDENGNVVDQTLCSYLGVSIKYPDLGRPCIVGQALADLGVTREELAEVEGKDARDALGALGVDTDLRYTRAVEDAQEEQDGGSTWGQAINFVHARLTP